MNYNSINFNFLNMLLKLGKIRLHRVLTPYYGDTDPFSHGISTLMFVILT